MRPGFDRLLQVEGGFRASDIREKLRQALAKIDRPGTFCVHGSVPTVLPGLEVTGLGPIGLPLTTHQAGELIKRCEQAPHGKGERTMVDTNVRRVWRLKPSRFALTNQDWKVFLQTTVKTVQEAMGLENQKLGSHLHELLLYEPGSFFLPHRDGEKLDRMVATLVVVLPSAHQGGELIVRHEGQVETIDFSSVGKGSLQTHFAAFYADCEHEVRPLKKGFRLCLVYNLTLGKSKKAIAAPRLQEQIETVVPLVRAWSEDDSARKLVITLDHEYTKDGLAWDKLKGADRGKARVLADAAKAVNCRAYLALLTFHESGEAIDDGGYDYGYDRRSRWDDEDEDDDGEYDYEYDPDPDSGDYEMGEIYETSLSAKHWCDTAGRGLPIAELKVDKDELLNPEVLKDVDPEEEFEGYTGNAGMTLDRWYRHAAIVLWPERMHSRVLCDRDGRQAMPVLEQMMTHWRKAKGVKAESLKSECVDLAAAILSTWPENRNWRFLERETDRDTLLKTLGELDDPSLIGRYLSEVMVKDVSIDPGRSLAAIVQQFGWATFQAQLESLFTKTNIETVERNVSLLEHLCLARTRPNSGGPETCTSAAVAVVTALEAIDKSKEVPIWRANELDRAKLLSGLVRSLIAAGQEELLRGLLKHALDLPNRYPLTKVHVAALVSLGPWLEKNLKKRSLGFSSWVAACRKELEARTAQAPTPPADWRRAAPFRCRCQDCRELKQFLEDPAQPQHRFSIRQDRRTHLEQTIRADKCDLNLKTERNRSPHTLVCTKNQASYEVDLKTYHQDKEHLAKVVAIQKSVPT